MVLQPSWRCRVGAAMNAPDDYRQVDCPKCGGEGGPPDVWDEDDGRWHSYVCGRCSGSGWVWE